MEGLHTGTKTYQIRIGRMTDGQRKNYAELKDKWCIPYTEDSPIDFGTIFGNDHPITVEIGFGMGQATALIAETHPGANYIGIEVHKPGIGRLMGLIEEKHLTNLRIIEYDALEALEKMFPKVDSASGLAVAPVSGLQGTPCQGYRVPRSGVSRCEAISAFHIFFPDPWPKKRHNKRRLVTRPRTDLIASRLQHGGYLYMVTDWEDYAQWALRELNATPGLVNKYTDFAPRQDWRPITKFESRAASQGRGIRELYFVKQ